MSPEPVEDEPPDLRLVLPATAAWLVAWQLRPVPGAVVLGLALVALLLAAVVLLRSRGAPWALVVAATLLCAGAAAVATWSRGLARDSGPVPALAARSAAVAVEAVLVDDPRLTAALPGRDPLVVARVRVGRVLAGGRTTTVRDPVLVLSGDRSWLGLLPSQRVRVEGRLRTADPGDDVTAVLSARGPPLVLSAPSHVQWFAGHVRARLRAAVAPLPASERGLLPGLVVGDTSGLTPELRADFRTVGLTHLTAVSGDTAGQTGLSCPRGCPCRRRAAVSRGGSPPSWGYRGLDICWDGPSQLARCLKDAQARRSRLAGTGSCAAAALEDPRPTSGELRPRRWCTDVGGDGDTPLVPGPGVRTAIA